LLSIYISDVAVKNFTAWREEVVKDPEDRFEPLDQKIFNTYRRLTFEKPCVPVAQNETFFLAPRCHPPDGNGGMAMIRKLIVAAALMHWQLADGRNIPTGKIG